MKRNLAVVLLVGLLASCAQKSCRIFASRETSFCIPNENVLGSLWFLGKVSSNEVGFRTGQAADASLINVTLTRREYLCTIRESGSQSQFCRPAAAKDPAYRKSYRVVRTYLNERKSAWTYGVEGSEDGNPLANCNSMQDRPNVGLCTTSGEYKDIVYSVNFFDSRAGGVVQVMTDVDTQIRQWEVKPIPSR